MLPAAPGIWAGYRVDELLKGKNWFWCLFAISLWATRPEIHYSPVRVENMLALRPIMLLYIIPPCPHYAAWPAMSSILQQACGSMGIVRQSKPQAKVGSEPATRVAKINISGLPRDRAVCQYSPTGSIWNSSWEGMLLSGECFLVVP